MKLRRRTSIIVLSFALAIAGFFYLYNQIYFSHGNSEANVMFSIKKGEGNEEIAFNLQKEGLVPNRFYFLIYLSGRNLLGKIYPGDYMLSGDLTIPEIAEIITNPQKVFVKLTFPEGWTAEQIAGRLNENGFDGGAFLELVNNPSEDIVSQFSVLADKPQKASLEGYIFPDTYKFSKDATPEGILKKILSNTENKFDEELREEAKKQGKTVFEILTMASILEREVSTPEDFQIVSGIFWRRIAIGQALQSDATLEYVLKTRDFQHSFEQTRIDSPYNTYINKGLPPGPVSNPGLETISAALRPKKTNYLYFLTDPNNLKNTVYSVTFEEHVKNKQKYGL